MVVIGMGTYAGNDGAHDGDCSASLLMCDLVCVVCGLVVSRRMAERRFVVVVRFVGCLGVCLC